MVSFRNNKSMSQWHDKTLSELADFINGYAFKPADWGKDGLPIIRIEQLKNPQSPCDYYSGFLPTQNLIENGDLLFSWSASLFLSFWNNGKAVLNQHLFKVLNHEDVDKLFLKYLIEFNLSELVKSAHGSTMQHITRKELNQFRVSLPVEETEQVYIATILSSLDKAIEQTEFLIAKQQRIKRGLLHDLLSKGIDENGAIRSEATHEFKDSPLGRIPKEWSMMSLAEIVERDRPIAYGILMPGKHVEGGVPVIKVKDIKDDEIDIGGLLLTSPVIDEQYKRSKTKTSDLLFTIRGTVGRTAFVPECLNGANITQDTARISIHSGNPNFIRRYLEMPIPKQFIDLHTLGVAVQGINLGDVRRILVAFPLLDEQNRIDEKLKAQEKRIKSESAYVQKLYRLKTGLMQDLLTGKVRVNSEQIIES